MLNDIVIFFEVIKKWLIDVSKFLFLAKLLIVSNEKIGSEEFMQDVVIDFFGIIHLLTRFNSYPCNHENELKE